MLWPSFEKNGVNAKDGPIFPLKVVGKVVFRRRFCEYFLHLACSRRIRQNAVQQGKKERGKNMAEKALISASFLITVQDYRLFKMENNQRAVSRSEKRFAVIAGAVLLAAGVLGAFFLTKGIGEYLIWGALMSGGVCLAAYPNGLGAFIAGTRAGREFEAMKSHFSAQTVELFPDVLHICSTRYEGKYPYSILTECVRTEHFFLFTISCCETKMLPLRMLSQADQEAADQFLQQKLGTRYHREGK